MTGRERATRGFVEPRFAALRERMDAAFASGAEQGAALAVVQEGEVVAHLWGGYADRAGREPWQESTLCAIASTTKGIAALCMLQAASAGAIDLDSRIADYWPEFAGAGKDDIRVRDVLSHRAGLVGFHDPFPREQFYDWGSITERLAEERPWWTPGTRHGYHARTFGFLLGEVMQRAAGSSIGQWLRAHVALRYGLDVHVGLDAEAERRCAEVSPARLRAGETLELEEERRALLEAMADPATPTGAAFGNPSLGAGYMNSHAFRAAELPAMNGHATALALAQLYGRLVAGDGGLLPHDVLERALEPVSNGYDEVLLTRTRFGLGFMLNSSSLPLGPAPRLFGHSGSGGSVAFADPDAGIGFAYVMNRLRPGVLGSSPIALELADILYGASLR